jgi:hypothetical protein
MGFKQTHKELLVPVAHQPEVGAHRDLAYVTRHEILYKWVKFLLCGSFRLAVYKEQTDTLKVPNIVN